MDLVTNITLVSVVVAAAVLSTYMLVRDFMRRSNDEVNYLQEDIDNMRDEIGNLRAEVARLSAIVVILSKQLEAANIVPVIDVTAPATVNVAGLSLSMLKRRMMRAFTIDGLNSLMFDMGIDDEEIASGNKSERTQGLIDYVVQRGRLVELIEQLKQERPGIRWD